MCSLSQRLWISIRISVPWSRIVIKRNVWLDEARLEEVLFLQKWGTWLFSTLKPHSFAAFWKLCHLFTSKRPVTLNLLNLGLKFTYVKCVFSPRRPTRFCLNLCNVLYIYILHASTCYVHSTYYMFFCSGWSMTMIVYTNNLQSFWDVLTSECLDMSG